MKKDNVYKAVVFHDGKVIILSGEIAGMYGDKYHGACYNSDGSVGLAENDQSLRIIASNYNLPKLPDINFNHLDFGVGVTDKVALANIYAFTIPMQMDEDDFELAANGFYNGYERCLVDMVHKRFTEQDMANFGQYCIRQFELFRNHDYNFAERLLPDYIQEVFKPKVYDVEVDIQVDMTLQICGTIDWIPRIENNQIKLIKFIKPCTD